MNQILKPQIAAIETEYKGVLFRSRLEAKWAAFFDLVGWPWQYEPFDLNGYIPDFILQMPHAPVIVEVKPELYIKDLYSHRDRIETSGWDKESVIVGACVFEASTRLHSCAIGIIDQRGCPGDPYPDAHWWSECIFEKCQSCEHFSFFHDDGIYNCRFKGCYDGDHFLNPLEYDYTQRLFADASNQVRWNP